MDVTDAQSVREAATQLKDISIDVLINSAVPGQRTGNVDYESWAQVLNVNAMGRLRALESYTDHIARSVRRLVVTITSGMGSLADNTSGGSIAYRSSKAAVNMGDAKRCDRFGAARHHLCFAQSRMSQDLRRRCHQGERDGHAAAHRNLRPKSIR
jgi:NAD(P)-dependent dehydrogenase (short-subunit alcohol dehydrogenase family)